MSEHEQVKTWSAIDGEYIDIDAEISELLELIWSYDIETLNSCQDNGKRIWLEFASVHDAENFINTLLRPIYDGDLYKRNNYFPSRVIGEHEGRNNWKWRAHAQESGHIEGDTFIPELPVFFSLSVRFPKRDHGQVVKLLKEEVIQ